MNEDSNVSWSFLIGKAICERERRSETQNLFVGNNEKTSFMLFPRIIKGLYGAQESLQTRKSTLRRQESRNRN